jgi:hypothetical protein
MKNFFDGIDELTPEYERFVNSVERVRSDFPSLWALAGKACAMSQMLVRISSESPVIRGHENGLSLLGIWNRIINYQKNSFFLLVGNQINEGLAILRMAAESTFILKACCVSSENLLLFVDSGVPKDKGFKEAGKMDLEDPTQKTVFDLYNYCSRYGVHGHITSELHSEPFDPVHGQSDYSASIYLKIWLTHFVAPHRFAFEHLWKDGPFEGIEEWRSEITGIELDLLKSIRTEGFFR